VADAALMPHLLKVRIEPESAASGGHGRRPRSSSRRRFVLALVGLLAVVPIVGVSIEAVAARGVDGPRQADVGVVVGGYERVLVSHDWPTLERLLAPEFVFHNLTFGSKQDRHGFLGWATLIGDSYPAFRVGIDDVRVAGAVAVVRFHEAGADGAAAGPGSTPVAGEVIVRVDSGRIVELWSNYDEFGMLHDRREPIAGRG
jgi:predicted SnoaL-like aldol condensation-catalyzing enzyme